MKRPLHDRNNTNDSKRCDCFNCELIRLNETIYHFESMYSFIEKEKLLFWWVVSEYVVIISTRLVKKTNAQRMMTTTTVTVKNR